MNDRTAAGAAYEGSGERRDRMRSQHPDNIAWREEQALRSLAIEGMVPRPEHIEEARRRRAAGEPVQTILDDMLGRIAAEDRAARGVTEKPTGQGGKAEQAW